MTHYAPSAPDPWLALFMLALGAAVARYGLELDLHDAGVSVAWEMVLAWETCGEVQEGKDA